MQKRVGILYIICQTFNGGAHNHAQKKKFGARGRAVGANNLHPRMRWNSQREDEEGDKGVLPACKAHPESRTGRGPRSCTAMFLIIARLPLPPRSLFIAPYRVPRTNNDILARTSAQQIAQTRTLQSGICVKATGGVGLIFMQGTRVTAGRWRYTSRLTPSAHQKMKDE